MKRKMEVSMLKILYLFLVIWNILAIISFYDYSSFVEHILPFNAIALITLKFANVVENLGVLFLRAKFDKGVKK